MINHHEDEVMYSRVRRQAHSLEKITLNQSPFNPSENYKLCSLYVAQHSRSLDSFYSVSLHVAQITQDVIQTSTASLKAKSVLTHNVSNVEMTLNVPPQVSTAPIRNVPTS